MKAWMGSCIAAAALLSAMPGALGQQQPAPSSPAAAPDLKPRVEVEPAALALVKAMSDRLAAAKTMSFTATTSYESPDRTGEPLAYFTL